MGARSESKCSFVFGRTIAKFTLAGIVLVVALYAFARLGGLIESRSRAYRVVCLSNLHQIHQALEQYAPDGNGQYPWKRGAVEPEETWLDLGLVYPTCADEGKVFICPAMPRSQRDESPEWFQAKPEGACFAPSDTADTISYSYSFDARGESAKPWTSDSSETTRLLADKKAGITATGADLKRAAHSAERRNAVLVDGSRECVRGVLALDPDPRDDAVGVPGAEDYTRWWSDPAYYGE